MANPEHVAKLKEGVEAWNAWREENPRVRPDLGQVEGLNAHLNGYDFTDTDFFNANLIGAQLKSTTLHGTDFQYADLVCAELQFAKLIDSNFSHARVDSADFSDSSLGGVTFDDTSLAGANFLRAKIGGVRFLNVDLSSTLNLDTSDVYYPCSISTTTIYKSSGQISREFLIKSGIPEQHVDYLLDLPKSLQPFEYRSCFISYTEKDDALAKRLYDDLKNEGVMVWRWREDAKWGKDLERDIAETVPRYDRLVLLCSEESLRSQAVHDEIELALEKEANLMRHGTENYDVLFPLDLDGYVKSDAWEHPKKRKVLKKWMGDFQGWDSDEKKYQSSFQRLLEGLKASMA